MESLIVFVIILLVLVFVHELGHFLFAKLFNVYCVNFSLGMGPEIIGKQGKETRYSLRALPIGGYVQMVGEEDIEVEGVPHERTIPGIKQWQKLLIFVAGAAMNFILAFLIFTYIAVASPVPVSQAPFVGSVTQGSPAEKAGLEIGDQFIGLQINGIDYDIETVNDLMSTTSGFSDAQTTFNFLIKRDEIEKEIVVTSEFNEIEQRYMLGYSPTYQFEYLPFGISSFVKGASMTVYESTAIYRGVMQIFTGEVSVNQLSGPIGIYQITGKVVETENINNILYFAAILSVNFGVINLLPIPALDGGRIIIVLIEMITRKKLNQKIEDRIHTIGFLFLMALIVYVFINDIIKLVL